MGLGGRTRCFSRSVLAGACAVLAGVRVVLAAFAVACTVVACAEPPAPPKALASSERDARQPIDDPSGFSWSSSAPDVKLLDAREAAAIHPRARAAAIAPDAAAVVLVEPAGEPLEAYTASLPHRMQLDEAVLVFDDPSAVGTHQARRFGLEGRRGELPLRYQGLVVDQQGRRFVVAAWTDGTRDLGPLLEGFALTKPRADDAPARTASGPGWRLQGGVFEDALARLRIAVPPGWRALTGEDLAAAAPGADLALVSSHTLVAVNSEPVFEHRSTSDGPEVVVGSRRIHLVEDGGSFHGRDCRDDRCLGVAVRGDLAQAKRVLAKVELLGEDDVAAIESLAPQTHVGRHRSLRGRIFRDHARGLTFAVPTGWRMLAGRAARRVHEGAALVLDARGYGVRAILFVDDAPRKFPGLLPEGAVERIVVRGAEAELQRASVAAAPSIHALSIRAQSGDTAASLVAWGPRDATLFAEALAGALTFGADTRAIVRSAEAYEDRRLGFRMKVPAGWTLDESSPKALAETGNLIRWQKGDRWFGLLALHASEARLGAVPALVEQLFRDGYGGFLRGEPARSESTLGDMPAAHLSNSSSLSHFDLLVAHDEAFVYAIVAADHDGEAFQAATRAFERIE